ncbi:MAG: hypothetical protein IMY86_05655 [Chloroflexi bacterium]|nr:hypothetical protein [Chloroflexota bacterium]
MKKLASGLVGLAILFALPFLVTALWMALLWPLIRLLPAGPPSWLSWAWLPFWGVAWLFSDMTRYLAVSLVALVLTSTALVWLAVRKRGQVWRRKRCYVLLAALATVLAFPLLMRYQPAVEAAPGVALRLVERPGLLEGTVRMCQVAMETRGCQYEPLGWADARTLVYRKWCGGHYMMDGWQPGAPGGSLIYDLDTGTVMPFERDVDALSREPCSRSTCVHPGLAEMHPGGGYFPGQYETPLVSPDGRWVAFTAEHIYGPEDLLVISNQ